MPSGRISGPVSHTGPFPLFDTVKLKTSAYPLAAFSTSYSSVGPAT